MVPAATFRSYVNFTDPMLRAVAASPICDADALRWLGYADQELTRLRELLGLPTRPGYALGRPQYAEEGDDLCVPNDRLVATLRDAQCDDAEIKAHAMMHSKGKCPVVNQDEETYAEYGQLVEVFRAC